ncbi:MAG: SDR family oxidoreductase [Woeseiaceae bacterium]|nr:SDR family oxidoreductase [Woeseiaceae bacterium]
MAEDQRLFGLRAVVAGAASGIGEAVARTLVKHGADVLAVDSPNSGVDTQFEALKGVKGVVVDLHASDAAAQVAEVAGSEFGDLDIVVCNVNPRTDGQVNDGDADALEQLLERKKQLVSGFCKALLPLMKNSPAGRVVIMGFVRSIFGRDGSEAFARSTASIAALTAELAAESGPFGINVNYIQPGAVMTPESRRVFNADKDLRDFCIQRSAAKRLGEPIDIAKVALFLATDDSVFVSGTGIVVDGGEAVA